MQLGALGTLPELGDQLDVADRRLEVPARESCGAITAGIIRVISGSGENFYNYFGHMLNVIEVQHGNDLSIKFSKFPQLPEITPIMRSRENGEGLLESSEILGDSINSPKQENKLHYRKMGRVF